MKKVLFGNEIERMPDTAFRIMKLFFVIYYFFKPAGKYLRKFGIRNGDTVVDYGCGTGACIKDASALVGDNGIVYAADIHELAIESVEKLIQKHKLLNVKTVLTDGKKCNIDDNAADLIYALDMFHMVKEADSFLHELHRIAKPGGTLIIEDGHQPRRIAREKILRSEVWEITRETKRFLNCKPKK